MFMYRFLSELIFLGCDEAEVIFLGCLRISWTDPPVCICAECPPLGSFHYKILLNIVKISYNQKSFQ